MVGTSTRPVRSARFALLAALGLVALCALIGVSRASATPAKTLGNTSRTPAPSCPSSGDNDPCEAVGSVTGFQVVADGVQAPFKARENGWVVAWAIDLSKPKDSETNFFGNFYQSGTFGTAPTARLSVIRRRDGRNYKLKAQSPVMPISSVFGHKETFTLTDPLKMKKGDFIALTIPTWAPSFAINLNARTNTWRASRVEGQCGSSDNPDQIKNGKPQQKVGSKREYGCDYRGARLLYWAYYTPR
jgi:hypothetical protein